jgi:NADH:ubiquinone oxidoreductase subunit H
LVPVVLTFLVLPFGRNMVAMDVDAGLLFFFAAGASTELAVFMAGWSSRNKYSLLGAMRAIAQMLSYELPFILSTIGVVMVAGDPVDGADRGGAGGAAGRMAGAVGTCSRPGGWRPSSCS